MSPSDRSLTMDDVAREAGVSRSLVSIAFRGVKGVSPEMRQHIFDVADRLGYRPNVVASRLASKNVVTIGVFLLDLYNAIFADIYEGVRSVLTDQNQHVVLAIGSAGGERDTEALDNLLRARANVVIAAGLMLPDDAIQGLSRMAPIVSTARAIPGIDSAFSDDVHGATRAVEHLFSLGHERVAHLASPRRQGYMGRRAGYEASMRNRGLQPLVVEVEYTQASAAREASRLLDLDEPPTAIFANNDMAALGVMDALYARGLRPGEDLSIVGYDNTQIAHLPAVSLTSVDLHAVSLGVSAAQLAVQRLAHPSRDPQQISSRPELVVRRSTQALAT